MGVWGPGLYQDDVACDAKEEYLNWLRVGKTNEEALEQFVKDNAYDIAHTDDGPVIVFALAETMWKYGRLNELVKKDAIKIIETEVNLETWKEDIKLYNKRKKVLEELKEKLVLQQPKEKK